MPTRSIVGTRERKMARIRSASPLPALMSCEGGRTNIQLSLPQWHLLSYGSIQVYNIPADFMRLSCVWEKTKYISRWYCNVIKGWTKTRITVLNKGDTDSKHSYAVWTRPTAHCKSLIFRQSSLHRWLFRASRASRERSVPAGRSELSRRTWWRCPCGWLLPHPRQNLKHTSHGRWDDLIIPHKINNNNTTRTWEGSSNANGERRSAKRSRANS